MKRIHSGLYSNLVQTVVIGGGLLFCAIQSSPGQALPAAEASPISTGFALPTTLGTLQYAVSASQTITWGYYGGGGGYEGTSLTGDMAYLSNSKMHPFSMVVSGGHSFSESGESAYSFLSLGLSQVASFGRWNFIIADDVSYLPGTPATGLSGVPGVGDLGVSPIQVVPDTGQGVLTVFSNRVSNTASASLSRQITAKTSVTGSGSYSVTRFLTSSVAGASASTEGLDNQSSGGSAGIMHQLNARNSFGGTYAYSAYGYSANNLGIPVENFASQTASASYSHQFSRKLSMSAAAGPQWTKISGIPNDTALSLFASVSASYAAKSFASSLIFSRSTNAGYGTVGGAISDSIGFSASRKFALVWNCSFTSTYTHTSNLPVAGVSTYTADTYVEGVQMSRALARSLSAYASYTLEDQSYNAISAVDVFSGASQVVGFGITYSPSSMHLGH